jgi:hypothetical protein
LPGIATSTVGVIVKRPIPVFAAALKSFTAAGAVAAAGTPSEYEIELVGLVQVPPATHVEVTPEIEDALAASVFPPEVENSVEVMVVFQPAPVPVASITVIGIVYEAVWSVPSRVSLKVGEAVVARLSADAPVTVPVAVTLAEVAAEAASASASIAAATVTSKTIFLNISFRSWFRINIEWFAATDLRPARCADQGLTGVNAV